MNGATAFSLISYNPRHLFIPIYFKLVTESEIYHAQVFFYEISTRTIIIDEIIFLPFLRVNVKRVLLIILKGFPCFFYYVLLKQNKFNGSEMESRTPWAYAAVKCLSVRCFIVNSGIVNFFIAINILDVLITCVFKLSVLSRAQVSLCTPYAVT